MKYRKRPIVVEAEQWHSDNRPVNLKRLGLHRRSNGFVYIHTLEGLMQVSHGDWIITGVKGEKYPCKPDIFEATYEAVE
jgi:hypothetical protein